MKASRRCRHGGGAYGRSTRYGDATDSTITTGRGRWADARVKQVGRAASGSASDTCRVDLTGAKDQHPGERDRYDEEVDHHEVKRKQPGGAPDLVFAVVLDHRDVELPRQQHDGEQRQQRHRGDGADRRLTGEHRGSVGLCERAGEQVGGPVEHPERHEHADADEGDELDDRLGRDRQHQALLVLGGVDVAGAEQHGEGRHRESDEQRNIGEHRLGRAGLRPDLPEDGAQRRRHRFELQRDIGDGADDRDQRDGGGDGLRLAVTRRDEVRDRGDVLRLGEPHDAHDQRRAQPDHEDGADVNRQEVEAGARGKPDRAEERPGGAIDRERERIDEVPAAAAADPPRTVAIARHHEQQADIAERHGDDERALQHDRSCVAAARAALAAPLYRTPGR